MIEAAFIFVAILFIFVVLYLTVLTVECPKCYGTGEITFRRKPFTNRTIDCPMCKGKGRLLRGQDKEIKK